MRKNRLFAPLLVALAILLLAASAPALTLCIAPCDFGEPVPPGDAIVPPLDLPPLVRPNLIVFAPERGDFEFAIDGDLRVVLTGGALDAEHLTLRSGRTITLESGLLLGATPLDLCAPGCVVPEDTTLSGAPGQISLVFRLNAGNARVLATGQLTVLAGPAPGLVPEPNSALLLGIGGAVLAHRIRRPRREPAPGVRWSRRADSNR